MLNLENKNIILATKSPRRQQLLQLLGINFAIQTKDVDESFSIDLKREQVALYLAQKKAEAFEDIITIPKNIVITADTIVVFGDEIINKPTDRNDAIRILQKLSGNMHEVFTGVCISSSEKSELFFERSEVYFKKLSLEEIEYYIDNFKPYDKAGAYGIQDWFGLTAIEKINGCFYNVMGLPTKKLYEHLQNF
jgi:septum formation protein